MKKIISYFILFIFVTSFSASAKEISINELPMYGNRPKTEAEKKADQEFIQTVEKQTTREQGAEHFIKRGWEAISTGDLSTAMKRFNQAWLLNPKNADIFHGFGAVLGSQNKLDESIQMFEQALSLKQNSANLWLDAGSTYGMKAEGLRNISEMDATKFWGKAETCFQKVIELDPKLEMSYFMMAQIFYNRKEYDKAWDMIHKAQALGASSINPEFLKMLAKEKADPALQK